MYTNHQQDLSVLAPKYVLYLFTASCVHCHHPASEHCHPLSRRCRLTGRPASSYLSPAPRFSPQHTNHLTADAVRSSGKSVLAPHHIQVIVNETEMSIILASGFERDAYLNNLIICPSTPFLLPSSHSGVFSLFFFYHLCTLVFYLSSMFFSLIFPRMALLHNLASAFAPSEKSSLTTLWNHHTSTALLISTEPSPQFFKSSFFQLIKSVFSARLKLEAVIYQIN